MHHQQQPLTQYSSISKSLSRKGCPISTKGSTSEIDAFSKVAKTNPCFVNNAVLMHNSRGQKCVIIKGQNTYRNGSAQFAYSFNAFFFNKMLSLNSWFHRLDIFQKRRRIIMTQVRAFNCTI